eukprot:scaffold11.g3984.t1
MTETLGAGSDGGTLVDADGIAALCPFTPGAAQPLSPLPPSNSPQQEQRDEQLFAAEINFIQAALQQEAAVQQLPAAAPPGAAAPPTDDLIGLIQGALQSQEALLLSPPLLAGGLPLPGSAPYLDFRPRGGRGFVKKRRARIVQPGLGQLALVPYGANEALLWTRRVAAFQGALRGVLGDRRLHAAWGGSVLDSNVADHLSSRAYMQLAARFPLPRSAIGSDLHSSAVDWEMVRIAPVEDIAEAIACRGLHRLLAGRIKRFLNDLREFNASRRRKDARRAARALKAAGAKAAATAAAEPAAAAELAAPEPGAHGEQGQEQGQRRREHVALEYEEEAAAAAARAAEAEARELLSLEWLHSASDEEAQSWLMGVDGLGVKSTSCIMLLTLGKKAFPVDTNVGRIASRLGWVPLDHADVVDDELAPEPEVHSFLRKRLLGFPVEVLQELHYNMISLGKVFCQKQTANCAACPLNEDCDFAAASELGRKRRPRVRQPAPYLPGQGGGRPRMYGVDGRPLHWKTVARLQRLQREAELREHSWPGLDLDVLVAAARRSRKPRTPGRRARASLGGPLPGGDPLPPPETPACADDWCDLAGEMGGTASGIGSASLLVDSLPTGSPAQEEQARWQPAGAAGNGAVDVAAATPQAPASLGAAQLAVQVMDEESAPVPSTAVLEADAVAAQSTGPGSALDSGSGGPGTSGSIGAAADDQEAEMEGEDEGRASLDLEQLDEELDEAILEAMELELADNEEDDAATAAEEVALAALHCERMERLGQELAEAQRQLMVEAGLPNASSDNTAAIRERCMELSLAILEASVPPGSAPPSLRGQYRQFARLLHPDKCDHLHAADAFAALSAAFRFATGQEVGSELYAVPPRADGGSGSSMGGEADAGGSDGSRALVTTSLKEKLPIWTRQRLVVRAWLVPPALRGRLGLPAPVVEELSRSGDQMIFLPLRELPTRAGGALARLARQVRQQGAAVSLSAAAPPAEDEEQAGLALAGLLGDMLAALEAGAEPSGEEGGRELSAAPAALQTPGRPEPEPAPQRRMLPGVLVAGARACLGGRFPLRGSYFQINEVFVVHSTTEEPIEVAADLLEGFTETAVHFGLVGHSIFFLCRGMNQAQVTQMFAEHFFCCRAVDACTGAPEPLPEWLMPSVPTKGNTHWKSAEERAAAFEGRIHGRRVGAGSAAVAATDAGSNNSAHLRFLRVPESAADAQPPPPVLLAAGERPLSALEEWLPAKGPPSIDWGKGGADALDPVTPEKRAKWDLPSERRPLRPAPPAVPWEDRPMGKGAPQSQEAMDRKSGRGRTRRFLFPTIRSRDRCGTCASCLNPGWKKACFARRAEQVAAKEVAGMVDSSFSIPSVVGIGVYLEEDWLLPEDGADAAAAAASASAGRSWTVSLAVAASCVENAQNLELATLLAGQIARAAAIFNVDEVVVLDDSTAPGKGGGAVSAAAALLARVLQFMETPQYLKKALIPMHADLKYAGVLPPLDAPHHLRASEWGPYREGVVRRSDPGAGSFIDVGLDTDAHIPQARAGAARVGARVTLRMGDAPAKATVNGQQVLEAQLVLPTAPREEGGLYWGYVTRIAPTLEDMLRCPFSGGGYDLTLGTSERGERTPARDLRLPRFRRLLLVLGGPDGLEAALQADPWATRHAAPAELFGRYLNTCFDQGSRTIRTEEALLISLAFLQPALAATQGAATFERPTAEAAAVALASAAQQQQQQQPPQHNARIVAAFRSDHTELEVTIGRVNDLQGKQKELALAIQRLQTSLQEAENSRAGLEGAFAAKLSEVEGLGRHEEACGKVRGLQADIDRAAGERAGLAATIAALRVELAHKEVEVGGTATAQREAHATAEAHAAQLGADPQAVAAQRDAARSELEALKTRLAEEQAAHRAAAEELAAVRAEAEQRADRVAADTAREVEAINAAREGLVARLAEAEKALKAAEAELAKEKAEAEGAAKGAEVGGRQTLAALLREVQACGGDGRAVVERVGQLGACYASEWLVALEAKTAVAETKAKAAEAKAAEAEAKAAAQQQHVFALNLRDASSGGTDVAKNGLEQLPMALNLSGAELPADKKRALYRDLHAQAARHFYGAADSCTLLEALADVRARSGGKVESRRKLFDVRLLFLASQLGAPLAAALAAYLSICRGQREGNRGQIAFLLHSDALHQLNGEQLASYQQSAAAAIAGFCGFVAQARAAAAGAGRPPVLHAAFRLATCEDSLPKARQPTSNGWLEFAFEPVAGGGPERAAAIHVLKGGG